MRIKKQTSSKPSHVHFFDTLNAINESRRRLRLKKLDPDCTIVIFDRHLLTVSKEFSSWVKRFPRKYAVRSGEDLKDLAKFSSHAEKLQKLTDDISPRDLVVLAVGGGSVGDFAGFFASVFKRGVALVHMPSTWLAAIDSSHGGKTALNSNGKKNQFGTFYPADEVVLVRSLLFTNSPARVQDAMGELGKIALISGKDSGQGSGRVSGQGPAHGFVNGFAQEMSNVISKKQLQNNELIWKFLKPAIRAKQCVVAKDPCERQGHRQILNFGHTMGHVFEAEFGWSHGVAVGRGLIFALKFSLEKKLLSKKDFEFAMGFLIHQLGIKDQEFAPRTALRMSENFVPRKRFFFLIGADKKKISKNSVTFIFLKKIGEPIRKNISIDALAVEAVRQGWLR